MKATLFLLGISFFVVVLLAGCSGSGVSPERITGTDLRTVASDHLSVVALLAGWLKSVYYRVPPGGHWTVEVDEMLPDGRRHRRGTNSDGSTFESWQGKRGAGHGTLTWSNMSVTETYGRPKWSGQLLRQHLTQQWSTGLTVSVDFEGDYSHWWTPQTWTGEAAITGGSTMTYVLEHDGQGHDELTLSLPDGSTIDFQTPVAAVAGAMYWPQFAQGADVTYTASGRTLTYRLTGSSGDWWQQMSFTSDTGFAGSFVIDEGFVGSGSLYQNGALAGALGWGAQAFGKLNLLGAGQEEVTPSAAARDLRLDQWANHVALMGPAPMY